MEFEIGTDVIFTFLGREYPTGKIIGYDYLSTPRADDSGQSDLVHAYVVATEYINYIVPETLNIRRALEPNDIQYYLKGMM